MNLVGGGSAGPALRSSGSSRSAGVFRAAPNAQRWKSRKAGERALRYVLPLSVR